MLPRTDLTEKIGFALVRIVVPLWILLGVVLKLEAGTARNLPSNIVDLARHWRLDLDTVLYTLIGLEIFAILVMVLLPRLARPMAIFMLVTFIGILIGEMAKGADKCGCFGASFSPPPWVMLLADSILLLGVLLFRPPHIYGRTNPAKALVSLAVLLAIGFAISFGAGYRLHGATPAGTPDVEPHKADDDPTVNPSPKRVPNNWYPRPDAVIDRPWREIELFQFMHRWPKGLDEGTHYIVFYRRTCDHCLRMFEEDFALPFEAPLLAYEIPESRTVMTSTRGDAWDIPPIDPGVRLVSLPLGPDWSLMTAPTAMRIEDGIVTCFQEGDHRECLELD